MNFTRIESCTSILNIVQNSEFTSMNPRLTTRPETVKKFRELLGAHLGGLQNWTDGEVQEIADNMLNFVQLLLFMPKSDF